MFKKLFFAVFSLCVLMSHTLYALEYDIDDIGTLQTHSSEAIDLNNQGQILGWYTLDRTSTGKHFFMRERNGDFHEIVDSYEGMPIEWKWLKDNEKAYGIFNGNNGYPKVLYGSGPILFAWDRYNGIVNLGQMPGREISTINNKGQVLICAVNGLSQDGKISITYPVIWDNGKITKLQGIEGDLGTESIESYGFDMNDHGDVVGKSLVDKVYKNNVYKQFHAVVWENGTPRDLHQEVPKSLNSSALFINNNHEMLVQSEGSYFIKPGEEMIGMSGVTMINDCYYLYINYLVSDLKNNNVLNLYIENAKLYNDHTSIWLKIDKFIKVNNRGDVIAKGTSIFDETHAMILTPKK